MAETGWSKQQKQRTAPDLRGAEQRKNRKASVQTGQAVLLQALLGGAGPEELGGLLREAGAGIPNSVLAELLSRQEETFHETRFRPLPERGPETEPFLWFGPAEAPPFGAADALPPPLAVAVPAAVPADAAPSAPV